VSALAHGIERLWCDRHGVYVRGWLQAETAIERVLLICGEQAVPMVLVPRPHEGPLGRVRAFSR